MDKFGFGGAINSRAVSGGRGANSLSWAGIFNSFYWVDPEHKTTAVIMMQLLPFLDEAPLRTVGDFEHAVYASQK